MAVAGLNLSAQTFSLLRAFTNNPDGAGCHASLVTDGTTFYGTTQNGGTASNGVIFRVNGDGSGYAILKSFSPTVFNANSDGAMPAADLVLSGGVLYGTAQYGGSSGFGTVFKLNTNGTGFTVLNSFTDGGRPAVSYTHLTLPTILRV